MDVDRQNSDSATDLNNDAFNENSISYPAANVIRDMLRELLTLPDYSTTRLAAELNISSVTVRRLLQGSTLQPSVRTFDKIVRLYCSVCQRVYANQQQTP